MYKNVSKKTDALSPYTHHPIYLRPFNPPTLLRFTFCYLRPDRTTDTIVCFICLNRTQNLHLDS